MKDRARGVEKLEAIGVTAIGVAQQDSVVHHLQLVKAKAPPAVVDDLCNVGDFRSACHVRMCGEIPAVREASVPNWLYIKVLP